ncbi:MAG: hypothetical protein QXG44_13160 [Candidatus Jordarchaeaceae archaeon]
MSRLENTIVCGVCRKTIKNTDIAYVDAHTGVAVCSSCALRISIDLVERDKRCLEEIDEFLKNKIEDEE